MSKEKKQRATGANNSTTGSSNGSAHELMVFNFTQSNTPVRSLIINDAPWVVAKDVCDVLELSRTNDALRKLDEDEKLMRIVSASGQRREMWLVNESGMYALIMRSNKPQAKAFRKWVTNEVLPQIRKTGRFTANRPGSNFIEARNLTYEFATLNNAQVRKVSINGQWYYSIVDVNHALGNRTESVQSARKLNKVSQLAVKIWLHGINLPSWFTSGQGVNLLLASSRKSVAQQQLSFNNLQLL